MGSPPILYKTKYPEFYFKGLSDFSNDIINIYLVHIKHGIIKKLFSLNHLEIVTMNPKEAFNMITKRVEDDIEAFIENLIPHLMLDKKV